MLFITNRVFQQPNVPFTGERDVDFNLADANALQSVFFCERTAANKYKEIGSEQMLTRLRDSHRKQLLMFLHGFSNFPENLVFQRSEALQDFFDARDAKGPNSVEVVPCIWPCVSDRFSPDPQTIQGYFTDQQAADASGVAFARVLEKLRAWQKQNAESNIDCLKRINVLAHSMGNRVLRQTMHEWSRMLGGSPPLIFRNVFMAAADVVNESLEPGKEGEEIPQAARNVVVYFASDDLALRASKVANLGNQIASRRLGHTGPENMQKVPRNVWAIDCDNFNMDYDPGKGHSYFLDEHLRTAAGRRYLPGVVFAHMSQCIETGRVSTALSATVDSGAVAALTGAAMPTGGGMLQPIPSEAQLSVLDVPSAPPRRPRRKTVRRKK